MGCCNRPSYSYVLTVLLKPPLCEMGVVTIWGMDHRLVPNVTHDLGGQRITCSSQRQESCIHVTALSISTFWMAAGMQCIMLRSIATNFSLLMQNPLPSTLMGLAVSLLRLRLSRTLQHIYKGTCFHLRYIFL